MGESFHTYLPDKKRLSFTTLHIAPVEKELGGGFKCFWNFHPYLGKMSILTDIFDFAKGLKPPTENFWQIFWVVSLDCCFLWMAIFFSGVVL